MSQPKPRKISVKPRDFSNRRFFPGTPENPYHKIEAINKGFSKLPVPVYAILLGGVTYMISGDIRKTGLIMGFLIADYILLSLLPIFKISFGPTTLTNLILALLRVPFLWFNFPVVLLFQLLGTFLVVYAFFIEPQFPRITTYRVRIKSNHENSTIVRIIHLSDLHLEYFTKRERRVINHINRLSPDFVVFTGDFFNLSYQHDPESLNDITGFFNQIAAKQDMYGVTGSPSVDLAESITKILPHLNMHLLQDQAAELTVRGETIRLIGLNCTHHPLVDANRLKTLISDNKDTLNILMYHSPDIAPHIQNLPIDLQLSGHTHGGQVVIPFVGPIYSGSLYGLTFTSGFYEILNSHNLIISRGLGLEGDAAPRVRFFSPPEIGLITLEYHQDNVK